jgi:UMP-CMP kinase
MGSGSSAGLSTALQNCSAAELTDAVAGIGADEKAKVLKALASVDPATKPKVLFVLGGPGVGKGTQCTKIVENFPDWAHISAGDCLRAERNNPDSKDGETINNCIKEGKIVPVAITVKLLQKAMAAQVGKTCFLIDGYPRNLDNVTGWEENVGDQAKVCGVLFYDATEEELEKRLLGRGQGRDDDNIEAIKKRFTTYQSDTKPIVDLYRERNQVISIDGMKAIEEVWESTKKCIQDVQAKA